MSASSDHITVLSGIPLHTRFPWAAFEEKWHDEFKRLAAFHSQNPLVEAIFIDHVNVKRETYQPRIDLKALR